MRALITIAALTSIIAISTPVTAESLRDASAPDAIRAFVENFVQTCTQNAPAYLTSTAAFRVCDCTAQTILDIATTDDAPYINAHGALPPYLITKTKNQIVPSCLKRLDR